MKQILISVAIISALTGCVVTPVGYHRNPPVEVQYEVAYPEYESAYIWDPLIGVFFFYDVNHRRHNMSRGWAYRTHGVPHRGHH